MKKLRKDLFVRPLIKIRTRETDLNPDAKSYYIFREESSTGIVYVPRSYGIRNFGEVTDTECIYPTLYEMNSKLLSTGDNNLPRLQFSGSLRPEQEYVCSTYISQISKWHGQGAITLPPGSGKTVCGLNIISRLAQNHLPGKHCKTLIVVHLNFLLDQWTERIKQYLPLARVGIIKGKTVDVEGKDIVIAMLQSLTVRKESYDPAVFQDFNFTIIDEVHHITALCFNKALFQINAPFILGLSGTLERSDGTEFVFGEFLGTFVNLPTSMEPKNYKDSVVNVHAITYEDEDDIGDRSSKHYYATFEADFRNQVKFGRMMKKLVEHQPRLLFITDYIQGMIEDNYNLDENNRRHVLIIGHTKKMLQYIHNELCQRNSSWDDIMGFYVGRMKKEKLKETASSKEFIFSTYSMSTESLDILRLNTIIMISPKSKLKQVIGRILRGGGNKLIVDIVDRHDPFKGQWYKRFKFYKSNDYNIHFSNTSDQFVEPEDCNNNVSTSDEEEEYASDDSEHEDTIDNILSFIKPPPPPPPAKKLNNKTVSLKAITPTSKTVNLNQPVKKASKTVTLKTTTPTPAKKESKTVSLNQPPATKKASKKTASLNQATKKASKKTDSLNQPPATKKASKKTAS